MPISYRTVSFAYILCFIPVIYKYFFDTNYAIIFMYASGLFYLFGFIYDITKFSYYKFIHKKSKLVIYEDIFLDLNHKQYFYTKLRNIKSYYLPYNVSEERLAFLYFFWFAIFHGVIMLYSF